MIAVVAMTAPTVHEEIHHAAASKEHIWDSLRGMIPVLRHEKIYENAQEHDECDAGSGTPQALEFAPVCPAHRVVPLREGGRLPRRNQRVRVHLPRHCRRDISLWRLCISAGHVDRMNAKTLRI